MTPDKFSKMGQDPFSGTDGNLLGRYQHGIMESTTNAHILRLYEPIHYWAWPSMTLLQYYHLMRTHDQVAEVWCTAADHCSVYADNTRQGFLQVRKISLG